MGISGQRLNPQIGSSKPLVKTYLNRLNTPNKPPPLKIRSTYTKKKPLVWEKYIRLPQAVFLHNKIKQLCRRGMRKRITLSPFVREILAFYKRCKIISYYPSLVATQIVIEDTIGKLEVWSSAIGNSISVVAILHLT